MVAEHGGLSINGLESVQGRIDYLEARDQSWDARLAMIAAALGNQVEISGAAVHPIPVPTLVQPGEKRGLLATTSRSGPTKPGSYRGHVTDFIIYV